MGSDPPRDGAITPRTARAEELQAVLELIVAAFGERARERMRVQIFEDSAHRLHQSRLVEVGGELASYVRVSDRPIHYGSAVLRAAGIGAVSTVPGYRGRGLSSALLRDCITYMRDEGYLLSMLFTGIQGFYARLGWVPFPQHIWQVPLPPPTPHSDERAQGQDDTVRPFVEETDLSGVEQVYAAYNARRTGTVVRDAATWRDGHGRYLGMLPRLVVERGGSVVAYASLRGGEGRCEVHEGGCLPGHEDAFKPLARAVLAQARAWAAAEVLLRLGNSHGLLAATMAAAREGASSAAHGAVRQNMMLLVLDVPGLLRTALPALRERLAQHPWVGRRGGELGLRVAGQYGRIGVEAGTVTIDAAPAARTLNLEHGLFWRLFLGASSIEGLAEEVATLAGVRLSAADQALLGALFPPQDPHYWWADEF